MSVETPKAIPLPPLREDLKLLSGTEARNGVLNWLIFDPLRNRYFSLYYSGFKMLSLWSQVKDSVELEERLLQTTLIEVDQDLIKKMIEFLYVNNLLEAKSRESTQGLMGQARASRQNIFKKLVHHYLFFRIPLLRPERFLNATYPLIQWVFSRITAVIIIVMAISGLLLTLRQWDSFLATFLHFFTWQGLAFYGMTLVFAKIIHELGHAYMAKRYGCKISTMGLAFMVMFPLLYTDVTDGWRLRKHRQRLNISLAGMGAELALASVALFLWNFLEDGAVRSAAFFIATTSWIITIGVNTNPFLRFDGYYILSDATGIENLQPRAFALTRWWMREKLFKFRDYPPEIFSPGTQTFLISYAFATWIYRFFLFLGIALLVYFLFFKVLGIILFIIEINWFILLPIAKELKHWWGRRKDMKWNINTVVTFAALSGLIALFVIPWRSTVSLPAHIEAKQSALLFPPTAAQITQVHVSHNSLVAEGDVLLELAAPQLEHRMAQLRKDIRLVKLQISRTGANLEENRKKALLLEHGRELQTQYRGALELQQKLQIKAPFDGRIAQFQDILKPGVWIEKSKPLIQIVNDSEGQIIAYSDEASLARFRTGALATFYPNEWERTPFLARVTRIDETNLRVLPKAIHASTFGGDIAVRPGENNTLIPEKAIYRLHLESVQDNAEQIPRILMGKVDVEGEKTALITRFANMVLAVLIRESGF